MDINFNIPDNIILILTYGVAWIVIAFFAYRIYKKQTIKPKVWKILIVLIIGLFSFSIHLNLFHVMIKLPILPLGVWILYFFLRDNWKAYQAFAWIGFGANFLFIVSTLIAVPIHQWVYPKDNAATFIVDIDEASVISIHPSANVVSLDKESFINQLKTMSQGTIDSQQWYYDIIDENMDTNKKNERFPYQLIGTSPKWGSGIKTIVYLQNDGKGILISTPDNQYYFLSHDSLLEGVE